MLVRLQCVDATLGVRDREALDQGVLVLDLAALVDGMLLGRLDLLGRGVVIARDDVGRHDGWFLGGCFDDGSWCCR